MRGAQLAEDEGFEEMPKIARDIGNRLNRLARTEIRPDFSGLSDSDLLVLSKLVEAGSYIDELFLRQVDVQNPELLEELRTSRGPNAHLALQYFYINVGPWDRLSNFEPFAGERKASKGAGFYPVDMTKREFDAWIRAHPSDSEDFQSLYTIIRRENGYLVSVPYSIEYGEFLKPVSRMLMEAGKITTDPSLAKFLAGRADALLADDYFQSDLDWIDLDSDIELTIGPYEVYNDRLYGYKASYEFFLCLRDREASRELQTFADYLPEMERNLPLIGAGVGDSRRKESPIRVVNQIFAAGDARGPARASAFNLPNDERIREAKGSKKILLKNIMEAKFEKCGLLVGKRVISNEHSRLITSRANIQLILFHEFSHGLGPGIISLPGGKKGGVRLALGDLYSSIEEAKADAMGLWNLMFLALKNVLPGSIVNEAHVTYITNLFCSLRLGLEEAHGRGGLIQLNYLLDRDAVKYDPNDQRYSPNFGNFKDSMRSLLESLLVIQANGDYAAAMEFFERYGRVGEELQRTLANLNDIPVDIIPVFHLPFQVSWDVNTLP